MRWKDAELVDYTEASGFIESILQDPQGTVWMTRAKVRDDKGPICRITDQDLQCYDAGDGIPFKYAVPLFRDDSGNFWVGSSTGFCRWKPGSSSTYLLKALTTNKGLAGVTAFAGGSNGVLWVGMKWAGKTLGLQQFAQGAWKDFVLQGVDHTALHVTNLLMDRNGELWVGTGDHGVYRIYAGRADHFGSADGLSGDTVYSFYEDREGDIWVVTSRGIDRFHDSSVVSFSIREGLSAEDVAAVLGARNGTVWVGNFRALDSVRDGRVSSLREGNGFPGQLTTSLLEDHAGRLWMGVDRKLTVYDGRQFRPVEQADGSHLLGIVTAMTEDIDHNIWAAVSTPRLYRIQDMRVREEFSPPQVPRVHDLAADPKGGIWLAFENGSLGRYRQGRWETVSTNHGANASPAWDLLVDSDGSTWATTGDGLVRWKEGKVETLSARNGLPCDSIYALVKDDLGSLWLAAECGYVAITETELEKWWQQPDSIVKVRTLDRYDGAHPAPTYFRPTASKSSDGKLWFATRSILQMVDPAHLDQNETPPPVRMERIIADAKDYSRAPDLRLPANTRNIEIDYTALSFVVPEKVHFRYKLEGHDEDWQYPHSRRQAFYSDLAPGNYRFRVIACNNDGVWNNTGATQDFTVLPAFYQTTWFRLLCFAIGAGILWLLYALRLRQVAAHMQARLEERLEERERIARDLHDTLLQGFLSAYMQLDVANDRLPADSPAKPLVQRVLDLMKQVSAEGRDAIRRLRSPYQESENLEQKLSQIREEFPLQEQVDFRVIVEGAPQSLHPAIRDEVYRISREAVMNAFRHSQASKIQVAIYYAARHLRVVVRDNGCGVDPQLLRTGREGHWGLSIMKERAENVGASFGVSSRAGRAPRSNSWFREKWLLRPCLQQACGSG